MNARPLLLTIAGSIFVYPAASIAHHSGLEYDNNAIGEIEGGVIAKFWRNPHVQFTVRTIGDDGSEIDWEIEGNSLNGLARLGIVPDVIAVGDAVKVAGPVARNGAPEMRASNVLLADGTELIMLRGNRPLRWTTQRAGGSPTVAAIDPVADPAQAEGIYRLWGNARGQLLRNVEFPLTSAARAVQESWQPRDDEPVTRCAAPGLPMVMSNPYPKMFVDGGDRIELRLEYFDTQRTIRMDADSDAEARPKTLLGYSVGHWEGRSLVVETSGGDWPYFNRYGVRLTDAASFVERFTLSDDEQELEYQVTVSDPETFTEPVVLFQTWRWLPQETIRPYECAMPSGD